MRSHSLFLAFFLFFSFGSRGQMTQLTVGTAALPEAFYDGKIDPSGGTIQVGQITNAGTGTDIFMVKLNAAHQVVWQKVIVNTGNDYAYNVIICANGDYVVTGELFQAAATRGFVCRVNSANGNIIWNFISTAPASPSGDKLYNARETSNGNIVAVGVSNFALNQTNSYIILLNSFGTLQWSRTSTQPVSDEFRSVNQLPNGNLIVGGMYNAGGFYRPVILEMNETTAAIVAQNQYSINTTIPGVPLTINSMWTQNIFIKNGAVIVTGYAFENYTGDSYPVEYVYDQTTKNLSGNLCYHTGSLPNQGYYIYPISSQDFLLAFFTSSPAVAGFVSRVTNNAIVYARRINGGSAAALSLDVLNNNLLLSGWTNNGADQDGYRLTTTTSFPLSTTPCNVTAGNTLVLQASNLAAVAANPITFTASNTASSATLTTANSGYASAIICSCDLIAVNTAPVNTSICAGANASFSIAALNNTTFQWQESTNGGGSWNNITNGGIYAGATTNTLNLTGVTAGMNNYQYRCVLTNLCDNVNSAPAILTVTAPATAGISINGSANPVCPGVTVTFTATALNGGSTPAYQWKKNNVNVGTNSPVYSTNSLANGDVITCVLTSNANCVTGNPATSNAIAMTVISNIRYPNIVANVNQVVQLTARNLGVNNYLWQPATGLNNAIISNPLFSYNQDVEYRIAITLAAGCIVVDTQLVKVQGIKDILVPRAFSPNSNGINDRLYPFLLGISKLNYFRIYNRWGNLIFETNSAVPSSGWDGKYKGKLQPAETYTWIAEGIDIDGVVIKRGGNTLLIR